MKSWFCSGPDEKVTAITCILILMYTVSEFEFFFELYILLDYLPVGDEPEDEFLCKEVIKLYCVSKWMKGWLSRRDRWLYCDGGLLDRWLYWGGGLLDRWLCWDLDSWSGTWMVANLFMSVVTKSSHVCLPQHFWFAMIWFMSKIILKTCGELFTIPGLLNFSCGGNMLMNVGPTKYGMILPVFEERLLNMGQWLNVNGEGIYASHPWQYQNDTANPDVWWVPHTHTHPVPLCLCPLPPILSSAVTYNNLKQNEASYTFVESTKKGVPWWSLGTFYNILLACQMRVTADDLGLCCIHMKYFILSNCASSSVLVFSFFCISVS